MSEVSTLLDKARERRSIPSDMALAASLSVSRSIVSEWRKGSKHPSDEHICALAKMAGEPAKNWLVSVQASRATGAARKAWGELARQLGVAATVAVAALVTGWMPSPVQARTLPTAQAEQTSLYALCEVLAKWARKLLGTVKALMRDRMELQPA